MTIVGAVASAELNPRKLPINPKRDCVEAEDNATNGGNNMSNTEHRWSADAVPQQQQYESPSGNVGFNDGVAIGSFQQEASQWLMDFDLSDPYDMSWFHVAPDADF